MNLLSATIQLCTSSNFVLEMGLQMRWVQDTHNERSMEFISISCVNACQVSGIKSQNNL